MSFPTLLQILLQTKVTFSSKEPESLTFNGCDFPHELFVQLLKVKADFWEELSKENKFSLPNQLKRRYLNLIHEAKKMFIVIENTVIPINFMAYKKKRKIKFYELSPREQEEICTYINIQYQALIQLEQELSVEEEEEITEEVTEEVTEDHFIWLGNQNDLLEICTFLYKTDYIGLNNHSLSLLYKRIFNLFGIELPKNLHTAIHKLEARKNPTVFLEKLLKESKEYLHCL